MGMMMLHLEQFILPGPGFFSGGQGPAADIFGVLIADCQIGGYPEQVLKIIDHSHVATGHLLGGKVTNMLTRHRLPSR